MEKELTIVSADEYLPLRDVVFNTLRQAILKGEMEPGERLMEITLANKLGVSRTPIREAIRKLELEGLVNMIPRKGAVVASISEKDMRDVLEVRITLEELAVKLAINNMGNEDVDMLKKAGLVFENAVISRDIVNMVEADVAFHDIIYNKTGNNRLIQIINNLREQMYRYRLEYIKDARTHSILINEHNDIIESICRKDVEAAKAAVREHIGNQERGIVRAIKDR